MKRPPSRGLVLAIIGFGVFIAADDLTVVSTMLRQIIFDLEIPLPEGLDQAAWIVNAYLIAYVVVMPFIGRLSDLLGRRLVFISALVLFLAGSVWVPIAADLESNRLAWFIVGRVLTALGGGAMVPVGMAVIGDLYPKERRATALGALGAIDTAGWVWGPLYGAMLVRFLDWRWQFCLNIPLSLAGIAAAWWALRDLPTPIQKGRIDWLGTGLLTVGLLALNIALLQSGDVGSAGGFGQVSEVETGSAWPLYALAGLALALFVLIERRHKDPLIDLSLFRRANFTPAVLVNFLVGCVLIIAMVDVPLFINIRVVDVQQAAIDSGLLLSALTAAMAVMAYVGGRWTEAKGYRQVTMLGVIAIIAGFLLVGRTWTEMPGYVVMGLQLAVLGVGFGLVTAPVGAAVINAAPDDQRGIAASLVIVLRLMGMSVGLSGLTALGLYRFDVLRGQLELPPLGDPDFAAAVAEGL